MPPRWVAAAADTVAADRLCDGAFNSAVTLSGPRRAQARERGCRQTRLATVSRIPEANPRGHSTVRVVTRSYDRKVSDFTLPGKSPKESSTG
jgi:hypothetical protein